MLSLRNGTALAIVLSIAFVLVAVASRDQIPGFANDTRNSATSVANELGGTEGPTGTGADMQLGEAEGSGIGSAEPTQSVVWGDTYYDDDYIGDDEDHHAVDDDHHDDDHEDDDDD